MSHLASELNARATEAESKLEELQSKLDQIAKIMDANDEKSGDATRTTSNVNKDAAKGIELYYWPLKNRGNFARLILAESGIEYKDIKDRELIAKKCHCRGMYEEQGLRFDAFAPPFIVHGDRLISQTMAVMVYLSEATGLRPKSFEDNAQGIMIANNTFDIADELRRNGNESLESLKKWLDGRFQTFLSILDKPLVHGGEVSNYYFENRVTLADCAVINIFDGFNEIMTERIYNKYVSSRHKNLDALYNRGIHRAGIKRLLDTQKKEGLIHFPDAFFGDVKKNLLALDKELMEAEEAQTKEKQVAA